MRTELDLIQKKKIGALVKEHLIKNGIVKHTTQDRSLIGSPRELANKTNLAIETIFKLHSGVFSKKTLLIVEYVLEQNFYDQVVIDSSKNVNMVTAKPFESDEWQGAVPFRFGGYTKEQIEPYLGNFFAVRRSFSNTDNYFGSLFTIDWDEKLGGARFYDKNKFTSSDGSVHDFSQAGTLHLSITTGTVHLLTFDHGAMRLITLSHIQRPEDIMFGIVLTQAREKGICRPATSYIHFRKILGEHNNNQESTGVINSAHQSYEVASKDLVETEEALRMFSPE